MDSKLGPGQMRQGEISMPAEETSLDSIHLNTEDQGVIEHIVQISLTKHVLEKVNFVKNQGTLFVKTTRRAFLPL